MDFADLSKSKLNIEIDANSLWSDDGDLTNHLRNADFFNVEKFPTICFESTSIDLSRADSPIAHGKLSILGQTVEVDMPCIIDVTDQGLVVTSAFTIDRT